MPTPPSSPPTAGTRFRSPSEGSLSSREDVLALRNKAAHNHAEADVVSEDADEIVARPLSSSHNTYGNSDQAQLMSKPIKVEDLSGYVKERKHSDCFRIR